MTLVDIVSWLTSPAITAAANLATIVALLCAGISLWICLRDRLQKREALPHVPRSVLAQAPAAPKTWWEYLTNDLELSPEVQNACVELYNIGYEQLVRTTNNREEAIADAEAHLQLVRGSLSIEEVALAEELGIALAVNPQCNTNDIEARLGELPPQGQSYARLRATIRRIEQDKAVDLALGIPLTDFGEVKKALKEGTPPSHILDQLPFAWRMIRTINDPSPRGRALRKAVRPTRIRLTVHTKSEIKEDDRAELDEDWVTSDKLDMFLPFTGITPVYEGIPGILKDYRMIYVGQDPPGTESKFWARGGYLDRMLERAAVGEHPVQLRKEAARKRVRLAFLFASLVFLVASIVFRLTVELS